MALLYMEAPLPGLDWACYLASAQDTFGAQDKLEEEQKRREARQAAKKQQQQLLQQRQQQLRQMAAVGAAGQQPAPAATAALSGVVRGVIRSSGKWTKPAEI